MILRDVADDKRAGVAGILHTSLMANFPEFFKQDAIQLAAIVARSKICNEREYDLVRHRIDELEEGAGSVDERNQLYQLVDRFES